METLYLLLPLSLVFVLVIGWAFWWAVTSGQFEGSDEAATSILEDDDATSETGDEAAPEAGEASAETGDQDELLRRSDT